MEIQKVEIPHYKITLSAKEMSILWNALRESEAKGARSLFSDLEDIRPSGGFG